MDGQGQVPLSRVPIGNGHPPPRTHMRWRVIALLAVLYTINCVDRIALSVGMPTISGAFGLSAAMQGLVLSAFFWTYCGFQVPGGFLADRYSTRTVIGLAAVLWGGFQCLAGAATNGATLMLARLGLGACEAPFMPAASRLTTAWLPRLERARGITMIDSTAALGSAVGALLMSSLMVAFGSWRLAFLLIGLLTLVIGGIVYTQIRTRPDQHPGVDATELAYIRESPVSGPAAQPPALPRPMSTLTLVAMVVGRIGWAMIFFGLVTWGPTYLAKARGMNLQGMGFATFVIFLAAWVGEMFSGWLADHLQRMLPRNIVFKVIFGVSGLGALGGLLLLPHVENPIAAVAVLAAALFFHFFGGLYWIIPGMLAQPHRIGLVGGIMNFAGTSSGIAVPIIVGLILDMTGNFAAVIAFFAACALVYLVSSLFIDFRPAETEGTR